MLLPARQSLRLFHKVSGEFPGPVANRKTERNFARHFRDGAVFMP